MSGSTSRSVGKLLESVERDCVLPWELFEAVTSLRNPDVSVWERELFNEDLRAIDPARLANAVRLLRTELEAGDTEFLQALRTTLRRAQVSPFVSEDAFNDQPPKWAKEI